eukprot:GHVU01080067.1.p1 GENE.GHVU01080067.1~~GHVU01080067.1.p1  ORF type:complete len:102 (-),score=23.68 GHVU01080067.1:269-574(-)
MNKFIVLPYERYQTLSKDKNEKAKRQYVQKEEEEHKTELVQNKEAIPKEKDVHFVDQMGLGAMTSPPPPPPPPRYRVKLSTKRLKKNKQFKLPSGTKWTVF